MALAHSSSLAAAAPPAPVTPTASALSASRPAEERALLEQVLARNPALARAWRAADAAAARIDQARSLPDPTAGVNLFLLSPETRVGPQRLTVRGGQRLPWHGLRRLRAEAARQAAAAAVADVDAIALRQITKARTLLAELAFLAVQREVVEEEALHLARHEEAALARYTSGKGPQQAVVRLQSAVTKRQQEVLQLDTRRAGLVAALNALRDAPADEPLPLLALPAPEKQRLDGEALLARARVLRPDLHAADAAIARQRAQVALAERGDRPDVTLGLGYTLVDRREDRAGRLNPPQGDGGDILAFTADVALPLRRRRINAALLEQQSLTFAAEEERRGVEAAIVRDIGEHLARLPLLASEYTLLHEVLTAQAEEALRSAEIGYSTGELNALDLLDSEHVLFEVRTAVARTAADFMIAVARLEGTIASPIEAQPAVVPDAPAPDAPAPEPATEEIHHAQ